MIVVTGTRMQACGHCGRSDLLLFAENGPVLNLDLLPGLKQTRDLFRTRGVASKR